METVAQSVNGVFCVSGALEIYSADPVRMALLDYLTSTSQPIVDLQAVSACDPAGAQLLLAANAAAAAAGKTLRYQNIAAPVRDIWLRLGLPETLPAPSVP